MITTAMANTESEDPKKTALEQMVKLLVLKSRAEAEGIELTEEEKTHSTEVARQTKSFYESQGLPLTFISDERLAELSAAIELYYDKLLEKHTADWTLDEAAFETAFAEYKETERARYMDVPMKYAFSQDEAAITEARTAVLNGEMTFDELVAANDTEYNEENGAIIAQLWQLGLDAEQNEAVLALEPGGVSEVIPTRGYFLVAELQSKTTPPDEELREKFLESYTERSKEEVFEEMLEGWMTEADYTLNQVAYDAA